MQSEGNTIFVGLKISGHLRKHLDSSKSTMKPLFEENNPEFLQIMNIDGNEFIGKVVDSGAALERVSNLFMNLKTMLQMICPNFLIADDAIKVLAVSPPTTSIYY